MRGHVVAASGNSSTPVCDEPAAAPGVLCVTATDRREGRVAYANEPIKRDLLSVAAPGGSDLSPAVCGEGILSTFPPGKGQRDCGLSRARAYGELDGTSMSSPHVAGFAALLAAQGCRRGRSLRLLRQTARNPLTRARGTLSPLYGYGIVDTAAATARAVRAC